MRSSTHPYAKVGYARVSIADQRLNPSAGRVERSEMRNLKGIGA
jgi:hypothetical protein